MNAPTHDQIARLAYQLWRASGSPANSEAQTWFAAERQLKAKADDDAFQAAAKSETAAESTVEYHISPAVPDQEAIRAAMQQQQEQHSSRAPQVPHHVGPNARPPVSGKPIYDRPHSS